MQSRLFDIAPVKSPEERLEHAFDRALRSLVKKAPTPSFEVSFYPYAGLSSTIRLRSGRVYARVSDILRHSPEEVLHALACILIAKLYRLKIPSEHERIYRRHTTEPEVVDATDSIRRRRGFKITTSPKGKVYNLDEVFDHLNARYFSSSLQKPKISWGKRPTRRVLGHHDKVHDAIVLSPSLDNPRVPGYVVEYVLYHEMLHVKYPPRLAAGRTIYHGREFRMEEKRFEKFDEASTWVERNASRLSRRSKK